MGAEAGDDAVDHYAGLLVAGALPAQGLCLTVVRGVPVQEAIRRYEGFPGGDALTLTQAGEAGFGAYPELVPIVVADQRGGWTVLVEDNGFQGSLSETLQRLSADGGTAASTYWNVNRDARIGYAADGQELASFDYVLSSWAGTAPDRLRPFLAGLTFQDSERSDAEALTVLERISGVRVDAAWLAEPHPASVVVPATTFEQQPYTSWLPHVLPTLAAAAAAAEPAALRAAAACAAAEVCRVVGVPDPLVVGSLQLNPDRLAEPDRAHYRAELLTTARQAYHDGLQRHLDRTRRPDDTNLAPAERLAAAIAARRAAQRPDPELQAARARAHAIGAAYARLAADPRQALDDTIRNTYLADRDHGPALAEQIATTL